MGRNRRSKEINDFSKLAIGMDDVCANIYVILIGMKRLRVNELYRTLCRLGIKVSKSTFFDHLNHLKRQNLILREKEGKQNVTWVLNKDHSIERKYAERLKNVHPKYMDPSDPKYADTVKRWLESLESWKDSKHGRSGLPPPPHWKRFDAKEYYEKMPENALDRQIDGDIHEALMGNLYELKAIVDYDLELDSEVFKSESDTDFWKFIGYPLYRLFEKAVAQNCRASDRYRKKFFERIDSRIAELEREFYGKVKNSKTKA